MKNNNEYIKIPIPKTMRIAVWEKIFGEDVGKTVCPCCEISEITQLKFECGHIIAEAKGGETRLENLIPICSSCNKSMGTKNYHEFKKNIFGEKREDIKFKGEFSKEVCELLEEKKNIFLERIETQKQRAELEVKRMLEMEKIKRLDTQLEIKEMEMKELEIKGIERKKEKEISEKKSRKKLTEEEKQKKFGKDYQREYYEKRKEKRENEKTFTDREMIQHMIDEVKKRKDIEKNTKDKKIYSIMNEILISLEHLLDKCYLYEIINNDNYDSKMCTKMLNVVGEEIDIKHNYYIKNIEDIMHQLEKSRENQKINTEIYALFCESRKIYFCIKEKQDDIMLSYEKTYTTFSERPEKMLGKFKGNKKDLEMIVSYFKMKYDYKIESEEDYKNEMSIEEIEKKIGIIV